MSAETAKHSYIVRNATSEVVYSNETISHCPADFTFDVIFDGSLTELMQNVTVIDAYFEDTEYEFSDLPGILQPYNVQQNGSGVWSILPQSFYEAGLTYRVTLKGGVRFARPITDRCCISPSIKIQRRRSNYKRM